MTRKAHLPYITVILLLLINSFSLIKAEKSFQFERLDTSNGLSDNQVICIHQDQEGFLWFGTISGLNRYDGYSFKTFNQENSKEVPLHDQHVMSIEEDNFGHLWLEGYAGTYRMFDKSTHKTMVFPDAFGYYPTIPNQKIFLHRDGFAVLALKEFGVFIIDIKTNPGELIGKYLFDEETLKDNTTIESIYAKDLNNIWLSTYTGPLLLKIDPSSDSYQYSFISKPTTQVSRAEHYKIDSSLFFIVPGKGLSIIDLTDGSSRIIESTNGIDLKNIRYITGHQDQLWILTDDHGALGISNDEQELLFHITNLHNSPLKNVLKLYNDKKGNLWFYSTHYQEFVCYNTKKAKSSTFFFPTAQSNLLQNPANVIKFFEEDSEGNIWIGTEEDGIFFYDVRSSTAQKIRNNPRVNTSLIANSILSFKEDYNKTVWIGTKYGISKLNFKESNFTEIIHNPNVFNQFDNSTDALYKDSYGNIWCGTKSGELYVYDHQLKLKHIFPDKEQICGLNNMRAFTFYEDSKDRLWIGTKGEGLYLLDLKKYANNLEQAHFTHIEQDNLHNEFYDIIEDSQNRIWLASFGGGLYLLLDEDKQLSLLDYNQFLNPFCPFSIEYGRCILEDSQGKIWYGGLNGLISFNVDTKERLPKNVIYYSYNSPNQATALGYNDITSLFEDKKGIIWIGTGGGGLNSYQLKTKIINHYTTTEGLPNNIIHSTINDDKENLWISTRNGLSKFNSTNNHFTNYSTADGLPSNEFTEGKPFVADNKLFFGTIKGITYFSPSNIDENVSYPNILLTDFLISNKPIQVSSSGPLNQDINITESITLSHDQNSFTVIYSTSNYSADNKNSLEYKLDKFDSEWIRTDNNNITYTNIPPGEYKLGLRFPHVGEGIISPQKELIIIIRPPFWSTGWAYLIYVVLTFLILFIIINAITKIKILRNNLKLEQEVTNFKLQFFTNISHELRTPLTLIINPVKEVINGNNQLSTSVQRHLQLAYNNANNLLKLVNEILDFRKIQTNKISLQVSEVDVVAFFNRITSDFNYVAERKKITFEKSTNVSEYLYWFDPEKLEKVILNLLTNAFKFTAPNGKVAIQLIAEPNFFTLMVEDTGQGMDQEQRKRLFDRYYKAESTNRSFFAQGAGIGLSIVEEFVKLHHGHIDVESQPQRGTKFIINIPGQKKVYNKDDFAEQNTWTAGSESRIITAQVDNIVTHQEEVTRAKIEHSILLVEDNEELLSMLQQKLCQYYKVYTAINGQEGLKAVEKHHPNLIVTDLMMPMMDGMEMTQELKSNFDTCHIPVIMLTAKSSNEDKAEGYSRGADSYISKPFDFEVLIARIGNLLEQRKVLKKKFSNDIEFESRSVATEKQDQEFIDAVISYVTDHMGDENFNLQDMYASLGFSKTVFYNKIKALTELSPNQFVRTIKLKEAGKLLKTTNLSISEAAFKVGYTDINYFRTQFKKQFKKTPSEYMKYQ